jgi:HSP20 family protein
MRAAMKRPAGNSVTLRKGNHEMAQSSWLPSIWNDHREGEPAVLAMKKQLDTLFEDWTRGLHMPSMFGAEGFPAPRIDVSETDAETCITAELPGVEQKDIELSLTGRRLAIKGEKRSQFEEHGDEKGRMIHRSERSYGAFQRVIELSYEADPAAISATFKDGVLTVIAPKPAAIKEQTKKIVVKPS